MRGAECSKDYSVERSKLNLKMQQIKRRQGKKPCMKLNVKRHYMSKNLEAFQNDLAELLENVKFIIINMYYYCRLIMLFVDWSYSFFLIM